VRAACDARVNAPGEDSVIRPMRPRPSNQHLQYLPQRQMEHLIDDTSGEPMLVLHMTKNNARK
jgi:hypothetical protein